MQLRTIILVALAAAVSALSQSSTSRRTWVQHVSAGALSSVAAVGPATAAAPVRGKAAPAPAPSTVTNSPVPTDIFGERVLVLGTVSISNEEGTVLPNSENAALYITVKPGGEGDRTAALMKGSTTPAVGVVRIPLRDIDKFPYAYKVKESDLFPETKKDYEKLRETELTVAARLDFDGMASTRSPADLAGVSYVIPRGVAGGKETPAFITLKGRPPAVKFFEEKKQSEEEKKPKPLF